MESYPDEEITIPTIEVETQTGETVCLTWYNTIIMTYKEAVYNHVEWKTPDGETVGFVTPQSVMDALFENDFPYVFSPVIGDKDRAWYEDLAKGDFEQDLHDLMQGEI